ncbi:AAA family ATPase [Nocardia asteroides NBRC 15531]|uniref:ATPase n=1 Tax=Nocardia asteroides NBRC 15531 TaxID=1110697 RepID=U5EAS7_NOCAS|nr:AAA family ATPase [Nocardia asteroides]TLF69483.1 AAA family ATPase [Nocardia asteroides NBRC 15531]UGT48985.1 AAA family ATPase [Nocardia asteroides]SFL76757.1 transitional endoplasmic reticulum ATPase [Nocardia asteroides]VEG31243.1 ATP-dependent zinc metalloprotease FtsH 2 [Nocardia asteroides]GAD83536.1 putative ATPase [Nocardia asteroides NBRC 15531]
MAELSLTARLNPSAADARRGVVRLHPETLTALGLREWDGIALTGARRTAAVVAKAPAGTPPGVALLDDVTLSNVGLRENAAVTVAPVTVYGAKQISLSGSAQATASIPAATLRQALLGKVVTVGDTVSLLPRDLGPDISSAAATQALSRTFGIAWTTELLTVTAIEPMPGPVSVQPNSAVGWGRGPAAIMHAVERDADDQNGIPANVVSVSSGSAPIQLEDLAGVQSQAAKLAEWLSLALDEPELLKTLGAPAHLGVLVTGPAGVGKTTLAKAVAAPRPVVELDGPSVGAMESGSRLREVAEAVGDVAAGRGGILLITDIDALLPVDAEPVATLILDQLRAAMRSPCVALLATTAHPAQVDSRLRAPDLCDRELALPLPTALVRRALLEQLLRKVPAGPLDLDAVAARTPGFVVADLAALCREAAVRAAGRASRDQTEPELTQEDLIGALEVIRPLSRSGTEELAIGSLDLDDVGDMVETKQALTEAVLWPLRHPDSFARLGIDPPRGVLLYGPPGCGKTFLVRALAGTGQLSVHAVKGAELMDKWVGSSERAVRELFQRARDSAPSLIFLDEVDALAPRRGQSSDSGVSDRVVAALLTELDGVEPLRDVVVLGATNRPELIDPALLRPGRLDRLVFVPPPDGPARLDILRTAGRSVPLADDVDLAALAEDLDGYSAADCAALLREAALSALRRDMAAADVTAADVATARTTVRPSLDPAQVESLRRYAESRA